MGRKRKGPRTNAPERNREFAEHLLALMRDAGLTAPEVASRMGRSRSEVLALTATRDFFQICLLVNTGKSLVTNEITVRAVWPELMKAKQTVLSILAVHGVRAAEDDLRYTLESTAQYHKPICLAWRVRHIPCVHRPAVATGILTLEHAARRGPAAKRPRRRL